MKDKTGSAFLRQLLQAAKDEFGSKQSGARWNARLSVILLVFLGILIGAYVVSDIVSVEGTLRWGGLDVIARTDSAGSFKRVVLWALLCIGEWFLCIRMFMESEGGKDSHDG